MFAITMVALILEIITLGFDISKSILAITGQWSTVSQYTSMAAISAPS